MSIGAGIFLFVVGAILSFALQPDVVSFVDINLIGYILMGAGALVFVLGLALALKKRKTVTTHRTAVDPGTNERVEQQESKSSL